MLENDIKDKVKVQICFAATADLEKVREQLIKLAENDEFEFYSCFLPRHIVKALGFSTNIGDTIEGVLGDRHHYVCEKYKTLDEYKDNLDAARLATANLVNRLFVLDSGTAEGIRKEIEAFTRAKVIMLP